MIKDSGERRSFDTGAVRDIQDGKGRPSLMPLEVVYMLTHDIIIYLARGSRFIPRSSFIPAEITR